MVCAHSSAVAVLYLFSSVVVGLLPGETAGSGRGCG